MKLISLTKEKMIIWRHNIKILTEQQMYCAERNEAPILDRYSCSFKTIIYTTITFQHRSFIHDKLANLILIESKIY